MGKNNVEVMNRIVEQALKFTFDNGTFGMNVVDQFHDRLPETTCAMCGECCYSISFYSIEYHRMVRHLIETLSPGELRILFYKALNSDDRKVTFGEDNRLKCLFLQNSVLKNADSKDIRSCSIHKVRPFPCRIYGQERNKKKECSRVESSRPVPENYYETLLSKLSENSETFKIPTQNSEKTVDFFPFEFWVKRAVFGKEEAVKWFVSSHFYKKYLAELKKNNSK